jgi:ATP-dependent HslUV protease subunit HslV
MFKGTTIIAIKKGDHVAMAGDGQVSFGNTIMKHTAKKVRKLYNDKVLAGFAGSTADAFTLFDRFAEKLEQFNGNITRASIELAKDWRNDKVLRRLEALMIVADKIKLFTLSGTGDIIEPDDGIASIGSGGPYALAAARALLKYSTLDPANIVKESLEITANICIYTNNNITIEEL